MSADDWPYKRDSAPTPHLFAAIVAFAGASQSCGPGNQAEVVIMNKPIVRIASSGTAKTGRLGPLGRYGSARVFTRFVHVPNPPPFAIMATSRRLAVEDGAHELFNAADGDEHKRS